MASGRSFVAIPAPGQSARSLQARLLDQPDIIDAVPDGGRVRFVRGPLQRNPSPRRGSMRCRPARRCRAAPLRGRLHDAAAGAIRIASAPKSIAVAHPLGAARGRGGGARRAAGQEIRRLHRGRPRRASRCAAARSSDCSGPTAPARPPPSACCAVCCTPSGGRTACGGRRRARCARLGPRPARLRGAEVLALRAAERDRESRILRQRLRAARRAQARAHRLGDGAVRARRARAGHQRAAARRLQAAPRHGGGAAARAGNPVPRRADQRRRSARSPRVLAAHHCARRAGGDGHRHHAFHAGGRVLRPRRDHGLRPRSSRRARRRRSARWRAREAVRSPAWRMRSSRSSSSSRRERAA